MCTYICDRDVWGKGDMYEGGMSCIHYTYPLRCGDGRRPPRSVTFSWFSPFRGDPWSLRGDLSSAAGPRGDAFSSRGDDVLSPVALGLCSGSPPPPFSAGFPASSLKSNTNSSAFLPRFVAGAASSCSDRSRWFVFFSDGFSLGCAIGRDTRPAQRRARSCSEVAPEFYYTFSIRSPQNRSLVHFCVGSLDRNGCSRSRSDCSCLPSRRPVDWLGSQQCRGRNRKLAAAQINESV